MTETVPTETPRSDSLVWDTNTLRFGVPFGPFKPPNATSQDLSTCARRDRPRRGDT